MEANNGLTQELPSQAPMAHDTTMATTTPDSVQQALAVAENENADSDSTDSLTIIDPTKCYINKLPLYVQHELFKYLDRASSMCFGLTKKSFYQIHWSIRGPVPLHAYAPNPNYTHPPGITPPTPSRHDYKNPAKGMHLYHLLETWRGDLVLGVFQQARWAKLVSNERRDAELERLFGWQKRKGFRVDTDMEGSMRWRGSCSAARERDAEGSGWVWKWGEWVEDK